MSKKLRAGSVSLTAFDTFDTKRWIKDDGIHTYAHGHCKTRRLIHIASLCEKETGNCASQIYTW